MQWRGMRRSGNVQDVRGRGGVPLVGGGIGVVVIALVVMLLGGDPSAVLQTGPGGAPPAGEPRPAGAGAPQDSLYDFTAAVLGNTEDVWGEIFKQQGEDYPEPTLRVFSGSVNSACGFAQAAVGPFYCPADRMVYIDLGFYDDLREKLGAGGDFAQAYVIAHEVGHHIQNVTGISDRVRQAQQRMGQEEANALSVRLELQADCLAGVWGYHARETYRVLDANDAQEALDAASAIGDDRLQMQSRGYVSPESFTHGTSADRVSWFRKGFSSGDMRTCDTFAAGGASGGAF